MKIIRTPRPHCGYTQIDNRVLRDKRLSYRARGLLSELLSYPDGWEIDLVRLSRESDSVEGRDALRSAMRELDGVGYTARVRQQDRETGQWSTRTEVYDVPLSGWPDGPPRGKDRTPEDGFSGVGATRANGAKPQVGPTPENPTVGYPDVGGPGANRRTVTKDCHEGQQPPPTPSEIDDQGGGGEDPELEPEVDVDPEADEVLDAVAAAWERPATALKPHRRRLAAALAADWLPDALARHLSDNPPPVILDATGLLGNRLGRLPAGPEDCGRQCCARWRADHAPVICITHTIKIRHGESCEYCEIDADQRARTAAGQAETERQQAVERRARLDAAAEALGPAAVLAVTGRPNLETTRAAGVFRNALDDAGWDLKALRTHLDRKASSA